MHAMEGSVKRIYLGLLFAAAVITAGSLTQTESIGSDPVIRMILTAVIGLLIVWRIADFWHRHRSQANRDTTTSADPGNS